ncbi:Ig-like domain repeat protein [Granulicella cerasi]|uniref:Ig-like domain repeat protein n=1 Tax=Granulicella cerasi TaxID=741063 RepID=A0ABW1ZAK0_9BACT
MKKLFQLAQILAVTAPAFIGLQAAGQTNTLIPEPFATLSMGIAAGSGNTLCTTSIKNAGGQSLGDGCLPNQVAMTTLYDSQVDSLGNVYVSEQGTGTAGGFDIRVLYKGGSALTAALLAANGNTTNFTLTPGRVYTIAGGQTVNLTKNLGVYYCNNAGTGAVAMDLSGNGCPAAQARIGAKGIAIDKYGNIFFANTVNQASIRVVYVGGDDVAKLITLENPTISAPQVGYVYQLAGAGATGAEGDGGLASAAGFINPRYIAVGPDGNIYLSDGGAGSATVIAAGNNVRMIDGKTGLISTVAGENTCGNTAYNSAVGCPFGYSGDGGPAAGALMNSPYVLFLDASNNLFISDYTNARFRVVYRGGTVGGLTNPVVGYIYTYAGAGTATANGTVAQNVKLAASTDLSGGVDPAGNIYIFDALNVRLWKFDALTGVGNVIGGLNAAMTPGIYCSGNSGPMSQDNYGDGCPALQARGKIIGKITFDKTGDFYTAGDGTNTVQRWTFNSDFGSSPDGTTVKQYVAFTATPAAATGLTGRTFTLNGGNTAEFADAGGTVCTAAASISNRGTCVINVAFTPAHPGRRSGSIRLTSAAGVVGTAYLTGSGMASDLAVDSSTTSSIGSGVTAGGITTDLNGNVYVTDSASGSLLKGSTTGTALTTLVSGLKSPSQVAIDNAGNLYIADTGNNRVLVTDPTGNTLATLGTSLSSPQGVAVDAYGNIFVADTGNNQVLKFSLNNISSVASPLGLTTALSKPTQLSIDSTNDLYILDSGNARITRTGFASGVTDILQLDSGVVPTGLAVDVAGDVYITDSGSSSVIAYPLGTAPGNVLASGLTRPVGIATDADASLYIADAGVTSVKAFHRSAGSIVFPTTNLNSTSMASISLSNVGNADLTFPSAPATTLTGSSLFSVAPSTSRGCAVGTNYAAGNGCNFTGSFSPTISATATATETFNTNAANNGSVSALLSAVGKVLVPTTTSATVAPTGAVYYSQTTTLTITVKPNTTTVAPTGSFTLTRDGSTLPMVSIGNGTYVVTMNLAVGTHAITATYSGDTNYASSSTSISIVVQPAPTTTALSITPVLVNNTAALKFTATVNATTAAGPTGTVVFYAGGVAINPTPIAIDVNGQATYMTTVLNYASSQYTAQYSGSTNGNFAPSTSAVFATGGGDFEVAPTVTALTIPQGALRTSACWSRASSVQTRRLQRPARDCLRTRCAASYRARSRSAARRCRFRSRSLPMCRAHWRATSMIAVSAGSTWRSSLH